MNHRMFIWVVLISSALLVASTSVGTTVKAQGISTATPQPEQDRCEPNETRESACALAVNSVNGPYTFVPSGDQDWYRLNLGTPTGLVTNVTIRPGGALDLFTTISRDDGTQITTISSPTISTTLQADVSGGVLLRVENRSPNASQNERYTIEVRQSLPSVPVVLTAETDAAADALENNWDFQSAAPVGIGVVYDLNFVCPVVRGCSGGDHDYLQVPVKRGTKYLFATFDLGPGTDTVLDLYWGTEIQPIASNDDAGGYGFASLLKWVATTDGYAVIRVGPRSGGTQPTIDDKDAGTYRFAVAIQGTQLSNDIIKRVQEQTTLATPTPTKQPTTESGSGGGSGGGATTPPQSPTPTPVAATAAISETDESSAGGTSSTSKGTAITDGSVGPALIIVPITSLRVDPNKNAEVLQELTIDTIVVLSGKATGSWVRVTTSDGVMPGWIKAQDVRRLVEDAPTPIPGLPLPQSGPAPSTNTNGASTQQTNQQPFRILPLDPLPPRELPQVTSRTSIELLVNVVVAGGELIKPTSTTRRETPVPREPVGNVRVQLVNVFGDVLAEARTTSAGTVQFIRDIPTDAALVIRIPASGLSMPVQPDEPTLTIAIPRRSS